MPEDEFYKDRIFIMKKIAVGNGLSHETGEVILITSLYPISPSI